MSFVGAAVVVLRGEGQAVSALGSEYRYKVVGSDTNGAYSLVEEALVAAEGPPLHVHDHDEEAFYVLSGQGIFVVGEERRTLRAGDFVLVPRGVPHTLTRAGEEELRMLVIISPAGLEQFFVEVERLESNGQSLSEEEIIELAARFDTRIVGPPIDAS